MPHCYKSKVLPRQVEACQIKTPPSSVTVHIVLSISMPGIWKSIFTSKYQYKKIELMNGLIDWFKTLDSEKPGYSVCMQYVGPIITF